MADVCSPPATTRSATSAGWPLLVLVLLAGCASAGRFAALPPDERAEFDRCSASIAERRCHDVDPPARAACLRIQSRAFARRRTDEKRRQWLETNGCAAALIAGDAPPQSAATTATAEEAAASSPVPAPAVATEAEESAPVAESAAAAPVVSASAPDTAPAPVSASRAAPAAESAPAAQASAVGTSADGPASDLRPAGATCGRSAECDSDLCVRGTCVTLAQLAAAESCPATPARTAAHPSAPAPAEAADELATIAPTKGDAKKASTKPEIARHASTPRTDDVQRASTPKPVVADAMSMPKPSEADGAATPKPAPRRAPAARPHPPLAAGRAKPEASAKSEAPAKAEASMKSEAPSSPARSARSEAPRVASASRAQVNVALASPPLSEARHTSEPAPGARPGLRQARMRTTAPARARPATSAAKASPEPAEAPASPPPEPPLPRLPVDRPPEEQLRESIVSHNADMKRCVERQLKRVPTLRAKGTLTLDVDARGRVASAAVTGNALAGTELEGCLRTLAARWRFPSAAQSYVIEAPIAVSGVEGGPP